MGRPRLSDLRGFFEDTKAVIDKGALVDTEVDTEELDISKDAWEGPKSEIDGQAGAVRSGSR